MYAKDLRVGDAIVFTDVNGFGHVGVVCKVFRRAALVLLRGRKNTKTVHVAHLTKF